jgi:uncharacterized protein YegL
MPKFTSDMEQNNIKGTSFTYSATKMDNLGASEYTLVTIVVDRSGSVSGFKTELEKCIQEIVKSCKYSPRADNLMIRLVTFADDVKEEHGFKLLTDINIVEYDNFLQLGGSTALFDASYNAIEAANSYAKQLKDNDYNANGIVFVLTDGDDNRSSFTPDYVKKSKTSSVNKEVMESNISVLIGVNVNDPNITNYLAMFKTNGEFDQFVAIDDASSKKLAKLAAFVSKSISSQSQALGSGGPSQQISLTI